MIKINIPPTLKMQTGVYCTTTARQVGRWPSNGRLPRGIPCGGGVRDPRLHFKRGRDDMRFECSKDVIFANAFV